MDKELEIGLAKTIELLNKTVEGGGNFVLEQSPQLVKEIVYCSAISSFTWAIFWATVIFFLFLFLRKFLKAASEDKYCEGEKAALILVFFLPFLAFMSLFFYQIQEGLKAIYAPRVIILDYVKDAIKTRG